VPDRRTPRTVVAEIKTRLGELETLMTPAAVPTLVLSPADVRQLDELLGLGATVSGERLVQAIERLASIKVGDIRIPFTPGQLAELSHRAQKRGRTVDAEMRAVVARIEDELFYKGG
jgi:hypothetical protein